MRLAKGIPVLLASLAIGLAACGGDSGDDGGGQGEVDPNGTHTQYVADTIVVPETSTEAQMLGLNLDGVGGPDNGLGSIIATLVSASGGDVSFKETIEDAIATGSLLLLVDVQATSLTSASGVGFRVYLGNNPMPDPCVDMNDMVCGLHLDGSGMFGVDPTSPADALIVGQIINGRLTGGPGTVTLQIELIEGQAPLTLNLVGARVEVNVAAGDLMSGKLGGAIKEDELNTSVLPAIADLVGGSVTEDCMGTAPDCCTVDSTGETLVDLFDTDDDCAVSLDEIQNSSLISSLLSPDVDLFDANGDFNPGSDEVEDALSLGIGFTAVGGTFTRPAQ